MVIAKEWLTSADEIDPKSIRYMDLLRNWLTFKWPINMTTLWTKCCTENIFLYLYACIASSLAGFLKNQHQFLLLISQPRYLVPFTQVGEQCAWLVSLTYGDPNSTYSFVRDLIQPMLTVLEFAHYYIYVMLKLKIQFEYSSQFR